MPETPAPAKGRSNRPRRRRPANGGQAQISGSVVGVHQPDGRRRAIDALRGQGAGRQDLTDRAGVLDGREQAEAPPAPRTGKDIAVEGTAHEIGPSPMTEFHRRWRVVTSIGRQARRQTCGASPSVEVAGDDVIGRDALGSRVGILPSRLSEATVEKIAINAVMAECRPEYLPVTAIEALASPLFILDSVQATPHPVAPLIVVNGPIARVGDQERRGERTRHGRRYRDAATDGATSWSCLAP